MILISFGLLPTVHSIEYDIFYMMCKCGHAYAVEMLKKGTSLCLYTIINTAVTFENISVLNWVRQNRTIPRVWNWFRKACEFNRVCVAYWINQEFRLNVTSYNHSVRRSCIKSGSWDTTEWLIKTFYIPKLIPFDEMGIFQTFFYRYKSQHLFRYIALFIPPHQVSLSQEQINFVTQYQTIARPIVRLQVKRYLKKLFPKSNSKPLVNVICGYMTY